MLGIYAAITRQDEQGNPKGGWYGDQKMTVEEAIRGYEQVLAAISDAVEKYPADERKRLK